MSIDPKLSIHVTPPGSHITPSASPLSSPLPKVSSSSGPITPKTLQNIHEAALSPLNQSPAASPATKLMSSSKEKSVEVEFLFEQAKVKVNAKLAKEITPREREIYEKLKAQLNDPKQADALKKQLSENLGTTFRPYLVHFLGSSFTIENQFAPTQFHYDSETNQTKRFLWRGCDASQLLLMVSQGTATGEKPNSKTGVPTNEEVLRQVGAEGSIVGTTLPEFTTDPNIAVSFGRGNYIVVIEADTAFFVKGSAAEKGQICKNDAPIKVVAWKPIPALESDQASGQEVAHVEKAVTPVAASIAQLNEKWKKVSTDKPPVSPHTTIHAKVLRASPRNAPITPPAGVSPTKSTPPQ